MNLNKIAVRTAMVVAAFTIAAAPAYAAIDRALVGGYLYQGPSVGAQVTFFDTSNDTVVDANTMQIPIASTTDAVTVLAATRAAILQYSADNGYPITNPSQIVWSMATLPDVDAKIAAATSTIVQPVAMSFATSSRSLNSAFQVSSTRAAFVSYTVDVATTLSLTGGATGTVTLQYANDSGFTSGVTTVQSAVNGNTGTLTIGLALTQTGTAGVTGMIPAGKYVKLVTANTAGTPTFTFRAAQEVLMSSN